MIKGCMIAIILAHALTSVWALFPTTNHVFIAGYPENLPEQWFIKSMCDSILRLTYASVICLLMRKYESGLVMFFYITFWYYFCNIILLWYNFCQWKFPSYIMMGCLIIAAIRLLPKKGLRVVK